jgi:hypothetical protein
LQKNTELDKLASELLAKHEKSAILQESRRQEANQFQNKIKELNDARCGLEKTVEQMMKVEALTNQQVFEEIKRVMCQHVVKRRRTLEAQVDELNHSV